MPKKKQSLTEILLKFDTSLDTGVNSYTTLFDNEKAKQSLCANSDLNYKARMDSLRFTTKIVVEMIIFSNSVYQWQVRIFAIQVNC